MARRRDADVAPLRRQRPSTCDRSSRTTPTAIVALHSPVLRAHPVPALLLAVPADPGARPGPVRQRRPPRPGGVRRRSAATDHRGRPLRAARPGVAARPRSRSWSRTPTRAAGIGSVLLEHLAAGGPRRRASPGSSPRCCRQNGAMLRVFTDAGYQVAAQVRRRRGAPDASRSRRPSRSLRGAAEPRAAHRGPVDRPAARPARRRRLRRPRQRPGLGAAVLRHLRDGGFTGAIVPVHPQRRPRSAGCPRTGRAADAGSPSTWR